MHSYGGGGYGYSSMSSTTMRATSTYTDNSATSTTISNYSTAPMRMANGTIQTAASTLSGGILADETGFIPTTPQDNTTTTNNNGTIAPPQFAPLHLDWDALLFILLLLIPYLYRVDKRRISGQ